MGTPVSSVSMSTSRCADGVGEDSATEPSSRSMRPTTGFLTSLSLMIDSCTYDCFRSAGASPGATTRSFAAFGGAAAASGVATSLDFFPHPAAIRAVKR